MLLQLRQVLTPSDAAEIAEVLRDLEHVDGRATATGAAAASKRNLQARPGSAALSDLQDRIAAALYAHPLFIASALPSRMSRPRFSLYESGMFYGRHLDSPTLALSGDEPPLRVDVSTTVFLSDPGTYDGGHLRIESEHGAHRYKGDIGDAIVYPASTFHEVEPVTRGQRRVAFLWSQSIVPSADRRRLLFDLAATAEELDHYGQATDSVATLRQCYANLLRMWARP